MKYSDWKLLTKDEKRQVKVRHRPPVRIATLFSGLFLILFLTVLYKTLKTRKLHVNRNPTKEEAYAAAKQFVIQKLRTPEAAVFPLNARSVVIDTARHIYQISSSVKTLNTGGQQVQMKVNVQLHYIGGDWEDRQNWEVQSIKLHP